MSKSRIFIGSSISFAAGVFIAGVVQVPDVHLLIMLAVWIMLFAICFYAKRFSATVAALFLIFVCLGALRMNASRVPNEFVPLFGSKQELEGYIVEDVDVRQNMQMLTVQPKGYSQRILVTVPLTSQYFYGDWLLLSGKIIEPQSFDDFDYKAYLQRYNVYALMRYPKAIILKNHQLSKLKESLLTTKQTFVRHLDGLYEEPERSLLLGILIGARKTLPQPIVDDFNATGTSHIIAISGYNITIIITALSFFIIYFGRRISFWISVAIIAAFVVFTGASASVVRAAIMGGLLLVASNIGRQYRVAAALFFAGALMLVINPKILVWDVGFQLSFAASLGIIYFLPQLERLTEQWENPLQIKSSFLTTIAAIVATAPLLAFTFGTFSLVAPIANILVLPIIPITMLLGFLSVLPWVGVGFAFASHLFLQYILMVIGWLASRSFSNVEVILPPWFFVVSYVCVFVSFGVVKHFVSKKQAVEQPR